jgi:hypothetical protein
VIFTFRAHIGIKDTYSSPKHTLEQRHILRPEYDDDCDKIANRQQSSSEELHSIPSSPPLDPKKADQTASNENEVSCRGNEGDQLIGVLNLTGSKQP